MKVTDTYPYSTDPQSLATLVEYKILCQSEGSFENVENTQWEFLKVFGRLVETLVDKGHLTLSEADSIVHGYVRGLEEYEEE